MTPDHTDPEPTESISITRIEYSNREDGSPIIHCFGRDDTKNPRRIDVKEFRPYFYATWYPHLEKPGGIPRTAEMEKGKRYAGIRGQSCVKIYTKSPGDVRDIREGFEHHEADVLFTNRFQIDTGIKSGISFPAGSSECNIDQIVPVEINHPFRTCVIDIECSDANGWPDPKEDPITCITCHDSFDDFYMTFVLAEDAASAEMEIARQQSIGKCFNPEKHVTLAFSSEKMLLEAFAGYIHDMDPDVITGWNVVGFDLPYILDRFDTLGIPISSLSRLPGLSKDRLTIRGRQIFDLLQGYKKMHLNQKESYRLDAIASDELGEHKVHFVGKISELPVAKLVEYNFKDVELCVGINAKDDTVNFHMEIAKYAGCSLDKTLNSMPVIDNYILRKAHGKFVLPSKSKDKTDEGTFEGAVVFEPVMGIHENVVVLDLTSLYPMAMLTGNMSPDTKDPNGEICTPTGVRFKKHPDGLVREIQTEFFSERKRLKEERGKHKFGSPEYKLLDMKQNVVKVQMNSYYGISGSIMFRLHDRDIASSVTAVGRKILEHNRRIIEKHGYRVIFGDTDSCGTPIEAASAEDIIAIGKSLETEMNESYPQFAKDCLNADVSYFSVKFEKLYQRFFSGGRKKRYAGLLIWKEGKTPDKASEIDIVGYETKRSDSPTFVKKVQRSLIEGILRGDSYSNIKSGMRGLVRDYLKGQLPLEEIGVPGGFSKSFHLYEHKDSHIRGAEYSNQYLGTNFGRGSKPKRLLIKAVPPGYPRTDVICFEYVDQIPEGFVVDIEAMLEKTLKPPIERILEGLGWRWSEFDVRKTTLAQFGFGE